MSTLTANEKHVLTRFPKKTPRSEKALHIKSRNRIGGRKTTTEEIEKEIVEYATSGLSIDEIVQITGKHRQSIWRYLKSAESKGLVSKTESGRVKLSKQVQTNVIHKKLGVDAFANKYPPVKSWVERRKLEAKGDKSKLNRVTTQLTSLKVVCDTLKIPPMALLAELKDGIPYSGLENAMLQFTTHIVNSTIDYFRKVKLRNDDEDVNVESILRAYLMACRNFVVYNGISLPKFPKDHILSGKKVGFGQYAHVRLQFPIIDNCVKLLIEKYGVESKYVNMFIFYYMTGTRKNSIWGVETSSITFRDDGWLELKVYETKQRVTWTKLLPKDNPHFEILKNYLMGRVTKAEKFVFVDQKNVKDINKDDMSEVYSEIYRLAGITESYFYKRPLHALRHVSAHYWLDRTNQNYIVVARIIGWKDVQTLIGCYGEVTNERIIQIVMQNSGYNHESIPVDSKF